MPRPTLALLVLLLPGPAAALSVVVAPITFAGDAAPGVPGGTFTTGGSGSVNDAGEVAISAGLTSGGQGVWIWDVATAGAPTPVVVPGLSPIGPAGSEISSAFVREITASGRVGYEATLRTGPGGVTTNDDRFTAGWSPAEGHTVVARDGDPAPGIPGHTMVLGAIADAIPQWNDAGQALQVIPTFDIGPPLSFGGGLFRFEPGVGLSPVYVTGDPTPEDPNRYFGGGVIIDINEAGDVGFAAGTSDTPGGTGTFSIFAPDGAGGFGEVARVGEQATDLPIGVNFSSFPGGGFFALNDAGRMAFEAQLATGTGGVTSANDSGLWIADGPAAISLRYREGDPVPGSPGLLFGRFDGTPLLNDAGDLVLVTELALGPGVTVFDRDVMLVPDGAGDVEIFLRTNDPNPLLPGEVFGGFGRVLAFADDGALLFNASSGDQLDRFYYRDANGGLGLVTGEGMDVDLGGGDVRTIETFVDYDASDDATRFVASLRFTDGTRGVVLFSVPEPGTALLVALGTLAIAGRRRIV